MGTEVTRDQAFATNYIKGYDFLYGQGCGGRGAGACPVIAPYSYIWWKITPSRFAVRNRHLIMQNISFGVYTNAGDDGFGCANSNGTQVSYTVYLLYGLPGNGNFAANATAAKAIPAGTPLPFSLDFDSPRLLPQQNNPLWTGSIYVVVDFKQTGLITGTPQQNYEAFATVNLDFDQRV